MRPAASRARLEWLWPVWLGLILALWVSAYPPSPAAWLDALRRHVLWRPFSVAVLALNWAGWLTAAAALPGLVAVARRVGARAIASATRRGRLTADPLAAHAAGLAVLGLAVFGAGLTGLLSAPPAPWGAVGLAVAGAADLIRRPDAWRRLARELDPRPATAALGPAGRVAAALLVAVTGAHLFGMETGWDAMTTHLRLASFHLLRHKVYDVWHHISSTYPAHAGMLFTLARGLGGDPLARFCNAFTGLLALAAARRLARRLGAPAPLPAALLALAPMTALLFTRNYLDLLSMLWGGCAWLGLAGWARRGAPGPLVAAGCCAGLAMATKYTAVLLVPALAVTALLARPARARGRRGSGSGPALGFAAAAALLPVAPWLARNELIRGNPVHPFLSERWGMPQPRPDDLALPFERADRGARVLAFSPAERVMALLFNDGRMAGPLAPAFAGLLPLLLIAPSAGPPGFRAGALMFVGAWMVVAPDARFLAPGLPLLAALLGAAAAGRFAGRRAPARAARALLEAGWVAAAVYAAGYQWTTDAPFSMPLGLESRADKLALGLRPYPFLAYTADAIHRVTPQDAKILMASHFNSYYIEREVSTDFHFGRSLLTRIVREGRTPGRIAKRLRQTGFVRVLGCGDLSRGYAHIPGYFDAGPGGWSAWKRLLAARGTVEWQTDGFVLWRIGPPHPARPLPSLPPVDAVDPASRLVADTGTASVHAARIHAGRREFGPAERAWRRALASGADTPEIRLGLARALLAQDRPAEAAAQLQIALAMHPRSAYGHAMQAVLLDGAGRRDEARDAIRTAVELDPGEPEYRRLTGEFAKPAPRAK